MFKKWIHEQRLKLVRKWAAEHSLTVCAIVNRAGTSYIVGKGGSFHKIGKEQK